MMIVSGVVPALSTVPRLTVITSPLALAVALTVAGVVVVFVPLTTLTKLSNTSPGGRVSMT